MLAEGLRVAIMSYGLMFKGSMKDKNKIKSREIPKSINKKFALFDTYFTQKD